MIYVPLPGCLKFEKIVEEEEYLRGAIIQQDDSITKWEVSDLSKEEITEIISKLNIPYYIKS
jgi:hypothetical protein